MNITICSKKTNEILRTVSCPDDMVHLQTSDGEFFIVGAVDGMTHYTENGRVKEYSSEELQLKNNIPYGYRWKMPERVVIQELSDIELYEYAAKAARDRRLSLLAECDWTQTNDQSVLTKEAWIPYRAALRDIPLQNGFPFSITWPLRP